MSDVEAKVEAAESAIKQGWIAALISSALTLVVAVLGMSGTEVTNGAGAVMLVDVALILGFAYGIYRKSRVCAGLMLAYFLLSKIVMVAAGEFNGLPMAIVFLYFYVRAFWGTLVWHRTADKVTQLRAFDDDAAPEPLTLTE